MHLRIVITLGFTVVLALAAAPTSAMARHRHHQSAGAAQVDADQKEAAPDRVSPNPRAARMRQAEDALQKAMSSDIVAKASQIPGTLRDPKLRAQVTAALAVATLPRADLAGLRHRDGGYGWVGPVFWPFAGFDLFDASLWGDAVDPTLWGYGGNDLVAGLFGIYPDDALTAYAAYLPSATTGSPQPSILARLCGAPTSGEIAGVAVDNVKAALALDDGQRAALDDLAHAMSEASRRLASACPDTLPLTAQQRLAVMRQRVEAMIGAADMVAPPLSRLFDGLTDTQKVRFAALGAPSAAAAPSAGVGGAESMPKTPPAAAGNAPGSAAAQTCAAAQVPLAAGQLWPKAALARAVGRSETARKALDGLRAAVMNAQSQLGASCLPADATTPPTRLAAIRARLVAIQGTLASLESALAPVQAALDPVEQVDFDGAGAEPARAAAMAAWAQRARAQQTAAAALPAASPTTAAGSPADGHADSSSRTAAVAPEHHGHGRRHLVRYARRVPGPVHAIGRVLGALLP